MNFSKQLRKYRELNGFSQEELAEKLYVTRQTISKWENDKTYPDIHNLIALSILFDISLDELVKGDIVKMKNIIESEQMNKYSKGMMTFLLLALFIGVPSIVIWGLWGLIPFFILWAIGMCFAIKVEQIKKKFNVKTYKELVAFTTGESDLDELQKNRNQKKYHKEKMLIVSSFTLIAVVLALIVALITIFIIK